VSTSYNVEELKAVPIEDLLDRLAVDHKGQRYYCPSCQSDGAAQHKTPDLATRPGRFKCFKCGAGGDTIELATIALGTDFKGACDYLSREYGVPVNGTLQGPRKAYRRGVTKKKRAPEPIREVPKAVSEIYEDLLNRCTLKGDALDYCTDRGWTPELLERYDVKAIEDPLQVFQALAETYGEEGLEKAGLLTKGGHFRFAAGSWRHPILFPFYSRRSFRAEYIQGRRFCPCDLKGETCAEPEQHGPKYMGAGIEEGRAIPCLWNDLELASVGEGERVYVTEGIPDALSLCGDGLKAVAVIGSQGLSAAMIRDLLPFDVTLCGDRDDAGRKFNAEGVRLFADHGVRARAVLPPEGFKDWNEYTTKKERME
jgi:DNA primase